MTANIDHDSRLQRDLKVEPNLLTAIIAGVTASVVQTTLTYPFEFAKTRAQLHSYIPDPKTKKIPQLDLGLSFKYFFSGCGALNLGNGLKAGSRFIVFNSASKFMATDHGKTSAPRLVIAGAMTGFIESLWIIPFENIKTTMIENATTLSKREKILSSESSPSSVAEKITKDVIGTDKKTFHQKRNALESHPFIVNKKKWDKFPATNSFQTIQEIYQTRGFRGFFQGSGATLFRQVSNSAVQFGTYTSLRQLIVPNGTELNPYLSFALGVVSSISVIAFTQPIDVIKTRMQSRETYYLYRNSLDCAYQTFVKEGVKAFWSGWFPRLMKVGVSSGIIFTVYQSVENQITRALDEKPFQPE
jgi:hypothetical protein